MQQKQRKKRTALLTGLLTLCTLWMGWGQIVAWETAGLAGNEATFNATTNHPNLNTSILSRGSGLNVSSLANAFSSSNFADDGEEGAIADNNYLEFQIAALPGYKVSLSTLDANFRRSSTGPDAFRWRYSTNGTDFFEASGVISYTNIATNGNAQAQIDLSGIPALQEVESGTTITLRLYGWGASGAGGTFAIGRLSGDDLVIGGSVEVSDSTIPILFALPAALSTMDYMETTGPSASQSFEVSGINLDPAAGNVNVAAPANFEVSFNDIDYFDDVDIAYTDGEFSDETVYVRLKAGLTTDNYNGNITISGGDAEPIAVEVSGVVTPVPVLGWQIQSVNTTHTIDFDTTVIGVNNGQYSGAGFNPSPAIGQLNSEAFAATGWSDGNLNFGETRNTGDFARGTSTGGVTIGGFYAFEVMPENRAFGVQPGGSDFAPGTLTLRAQNQTGGAVTAIDLSYVVYVYNDQGRSNSFNFSYSLDNDSYTQIGDLDLISPQSADAEPEWVANNRNTLIEDLNIPNGAYFYLRWTSADVEGNGSRDEFALDDITLIFNPEQITANYTWEDGTWSPQTPVGNTTATDDILIVNGTAVFDGAIEMNNLYVQNGAALQVEDVLTVHGDVENFGTLVFVSTSTAHTAQFDTFTGTIAGNGTVTVERFVPARRAFRFVSSPVTTTNSINDNWQEGVNNPNTSINLDPNPGYGTHITGSNTGANGFDATVSGNPSLFGFDNTSQNWTTIANTNVNTLTAGTPYRLFIRGDRSVDVTSNSAVPTDTRLRMTGQLFTGNYSNSIMGTTAGDFNFVGNPYQAAIDMNAVLNASNNLNTLAYLVWDPTVSERGAYVTVDLEDGGNNNVDSDADEYLQPGQAAFVTTLADGAATFVVQESHKSVAQSGVEVFNVLSKVDLRLYTQEGLMQNEKAVDGLRIKFKTGGNNDVDVFDIPKLGNLDENLATLNDGNYLSIESRNLPTNEDEVPLFVNQYRHSDYVFLIDVQELINVEVWLRDKYLQNEVLLPNNQISEVYFTVDTNDADSSATDRFSLFFREVELDAGELFREHFTVFPNPSNGIFYIQTPEQLQGEKVTVILNNMHGQIVLHNETFIANNGRIEINAEGVYNGVYIVNIYTANGDNFTSKWIKNN